MTDDKVWFSALELKGIASLPKTSHEISKIAKENYWESQLNEDGITVYNLLRLPKDVLDTILFDRVGLAFGEGCNPIETQTWFLMSELTGAGGFQKKIKTMKKQGREKKWTRRRALRGKGILTFEYHVSALTETMQNGLGFIPKAEKFREHETGQWMTLKQIAENATPPTTVSRIRRLEKKSTSTWNSRVRQAGKGYRPFEYQLSSLPEEIRPSPLNEKSQIQRGSGER